MDKRNDIQIELEAISSLVAGLPAAIPYQLPADYFDHFSQAVLNKVNGFELDAALAGWPSVSRQPLYEAPEGYFETLAKTIMDRIAAMEAAPGLETQALSPLLSNLDKTLPYTAPDGYFTDLPDEVMAGIRAIDFVNQELETLSPVMAAAGKGNVYTVPDGYFNALTPVLPGSLTQTLTAIRPARKIASPFFGRKVIQYAAAALLAGAIATGAWFLHNDTAIESTVADMAAIKKISSDDIIRYLDDNLVALSETGAASGDLKPEDLTAVLADIPVTELEQYINQYTISKNTAVN